MNEPIKETKALIMKDSTHPNVPDTRNNNFIYDWTIVYCVLLAAIAGFIKYAAETVENGTFKLLHGLVRASVSGLSGYLAYSIIIMLELNLDKWIAAVGLAGYMGVAFMNKLSDTVMPLLFEKISNILKNIFK